MSELKIGDFVKVEKADVLRSDCVGKKGIVVNNPNPSNGCVRVKFNDEFSVDLKPKWLTKIDKETMEEQAPYGISDIADRPTISFDKNADKSRYVPKSVFRFRDIVDEMAKTYEKKNADYGNAYEKGYELFGYNQLLSRIYEKFCRVHNLLRGAENEVKSESISDTLTDMATQCVCLRMLLENDKSSIDFEKQPK